MHDVHMIGYARLTSSWTNDDDDDDDSELDWQFDEIFSSPDYFSDEKLSFECESTMFPL